MDLSFPWKALPPSPAFQHLPPVSPASGSVRRLFSGSPFSLALQTSGSCTGADLEREEGQNQKDQTKERKGEHPGGRRKRAAARTESGNAEPGAARSALCSGFWSPGSASLLWPCCLEHIFLFPGARDVAQIGAPRCPGPSMLLPGSSTGSNFSPVCIKT